MSEMGVLRVKLYLGMLFLYGFLFVTKWMAYGLRDAIVFMIAICSASIGVSLFFLVPMLVDMRRFHKREKERKTFFDYHRESLKRKG